MGQMTTPESSLSWGEVGQRWLAQPGDTWAPSLQPRVPFRPINIYCAPSVCQVLGRTLEAVTEMTQPFSGGDGEGGEGGDGEGGDGDGDEAEVMVRMRVVAMGAKTYRALPMCLALCCCCCC